MIVDNNNIIINIDFNSFIDNLNNKSLKKKKK